MPSSKLKSCSCHSRYTAEDCFATVWTEWRPFLVHMSISPSKVGHVSAHVCLKGPKPFHCWYRYNHWHSLRSQLYMRCAWARGRPSRLSASTQQSAADATVVQTCFATVFDVSSFYLTVNIASEIRFNAFQFIAQPNTALRDCILYLTQYLRSRHFTGLCKPVHHACIMDDPWGRVSEIQAIKETI